MIVTFAYLGQTRTLTKHNSVRRALAKGTLSEAEARKRRWHLRLTLADGKERHFKLSAKDADAIRQAKDILRGRVEKPDDFSAFIAERDARRGTTFAPLAAEWIELGLPKSRHKPRQTDAASRLRATMTRALRWWSDKRVTQAADLQAEFADHCMKTARSGTGRRTADIQLAAMSCLCQWAVSTRKIDANPFAKRDVYVISDDIAHCHRFMPANDEELHDILGCLWTSDNPRHRLAGGWLCFGALTGLRPHEVAFLAIVAPARRFPARLKDEPPGLIFPMPDGEFRMKVKRGKGGINPAVVLHPVLREFLKVWKRRDDRDNRDNRLFPGRQEWLADALRYAESRLTLRQPLHPHGFTRGYYVRVQKSMGKDPATVALELGQSTQGALVQSVYSDPDDLEKGHVFDWLPNTGQPAWELLHQKCTVKCTVRNVSS